MVATSKVLPFVSFTKKEATFFHMKSQKGHTIHRISNICDRWIDNWIFDGFFSSSQSVRFFFIFDNFQFQMFVCLFLNRSMFVYLSLKILKPNQFKVQAQKPTGQLYFAYKWLRRDMNYECAHYACTFYFDAVLELRWFFLILHFFLRFTLSCFSDSMRQPYVYWRIKYAHESVKIEVK